MWSAIWPNLMIVVLHWSMHSNCECKLYESRDMACSHWLCAMKEVHFVKIWNTLIPRSWKKKLKVSDIIAFDPFYSKFLVKSTVLDLWLEHVEANELKPSITLREVNNLNIFQWKRDQCKCGVQSSSYTEKWLYNPSYKIENAKVILLASGKYVLWGVMVCKIMRFFWL